AVPGSSIRENLSASWRRRARVPVGCGAGDRAARARAGTIEYCAMSGASQTTRATIVLLSGDGVGPEVVGAARLVLDAVAARWSHSFEYREALIGGAAIDATGSALPAETI